MNDMTGSSIDVFQRGNMKNANRPHAISFDFCENDPAEVKRRLERARQWNEQHRIQRFEKFQQTGK
jgi:hypothetical protein